MRSKEAGSARDKELFQGGISCIGCIVDDAYQHRIPVDDEKLHGLAWGQEPEPRLPASAGRRRIL